jgi:glycosyltransferase involved in cell wall biosynthesis
MKIAIDIRDAGGEKTGKGFFTYGLVQSLLNLDQSNQYLLYSDKKECPFPLQDNFIFKTIGEKGLRWHLSVLQDVKKTRPDIYFSPTSFIVPSIAPKWLKVLKKSTHVFVVSENTQNDLIKHFDFPKAQITEVPCAPHSIYLEEIDPKLSRDVLKKYNLPDKFILGVGTIEPRKNYTNLIKAFIVVKRKYPDLKLVIVGKKGWKFNEIDQLVKQHKLEQEVIFTGYVNDQDLHHIYHSAEVFVFPSIYEGFGIPPLEAMASGCPVIASNSSSLPEVIGDAGLLIDPKSSPKIADAIVSILETPQLRSTLIEKGFFRSRKFNWEKSAEIALAELNSLNN